jgi:hypothetical protein
VGLFPGRLDGILGILGPFLGVLGGLPGPFGPLPRLFRLRLELAGPFDGPLLLLLVGPFLG